MRSVFVYAIVVAALASLVNSSSSALPQQDGATAYILPNGLQDQHFRKDADGNYSVRIELFQKAGGAWSRVAAPATFRLFVCEAPVEESHNATTDPLQVSVSVSADTDCLVDTLSIPFTSLANGPVQLKWSGDALGNPTLANPKLVDAFVEFAAPGLEGHTSHHSSEKNELIRTARAATTPDALRGTLFDAADSLDNAGALLGVAA